MYVYSTLSCQFSFALVFLFICFHLFIAISIII